MAARTQPTPARLASKRGDAQHWGRRLDALRVKHDVSIRSFVELLGGDDSPLGKTATHDLLSGRCTPRMEGAIKPIIAAKIRKWLRDEKKTKLEIEREMLEIFHEPICNQNQEVESVLTQRTELPRDAQKYFSLTRDPFTGDPRDHREIFTTPQTDKVLAQLEDAVNYQKFVAVIGDVGAGKLIMKRRIEQACARSQGKMRLLWPKFPNMEAVHSGSICSFILREFQEPSSHDRVLRAQRVEKLFTSLSDQGIRIALGFDECHRLDPRLLTALKNFYEMGNSGFDRYLGLILLGQPKFRTTLNYPEHREITERLTIIDLGYDKAKKGRAAATNGHCLGTFAWEYVAHRLRIAGGNADRLFDRDSIARLAQIGDTPQALGNLCNAALVQAAEIGEKKVHIGVLRAARIIEDDQPRARRG